MTPIVNLPWYDSPAAAKSLDFFWSALRQELVLLGFQDLPITLNRGGSLVDQWQDPNLFLSQCCGPDLFTESTSGVSCLGRPIFTDLDCAAGYYYSHIVSLGSPLLNPRIAINSPSSWSGHYALERWLAESGLESSVRIVSGSHQQSLNLLRLGKDDLIAVDAHYWNLLDTEDAVIIDRSQTAPTPPFITNLADEDARQLLRGALENSLAVHGHSLGISGMLLSDRKIYQPFSAVAESSADAAMLLPQLD